MAVSWFLKKSFTLPPQGLPFAAVFVLRAWLF